MKCCCIFQPQKSLTSDVPTRRSTAVDLDNALRHSGWITNLAVSAPHRLHQLRRTESHHLVFRGPRHDFFSFCMDEHIGGDSNSSSADTQEATYMLTPQHAKIQCLIETVGHDLHTLGFSIFFVLMDHVQPHQTRKRSVRVFFLRSTHRDLRSASSSWCDLDDDAGHPHLRKTVLSARDEPEGLYPTGGSDALQTSVPTNTV